MKLLKLIHLGDPLLRQKARRLTPEEIESSKIQSLIADIRHTNQVKRYGIGLAAPQVGVSVALSVIGIKPTPTRPNLEPFNQVIINSSYIGIGQPEPRWEGCQSAGSGDDTLYAQAERYAAIKATWTDETGTLHAETLEGMHAHVFQHETDHLNGILFVDRVTDSRTFMVASEYRKMKAKEQQSEQNTA